METPTIPTIYKEEQFEQFLKTIEETTAPHWVDIANAIGIDQGTIIAWKKHPRAQEAIRKGIEHALKQMEQSGEKDWKMWREKLNMLGVKEQKEGTLSQQFNQFNILNIDRDEAEQLSDKFTRFMLEEKQ